MLDALCCGGVTHSVGSKGNGMNKRKKKSVRYLCVNAGFSLLGLPVAGEVVQSAILHEGSEGEDEANRDKQVHGSDIRNLGQGLSGDGAESRHGEHCGDTYIDYHKDMVYLYTFSATKCRYN